MEDQTRYAEKVGIWAENSHTGGYWYKTTMNESEYLSRDESAEDRQRGKSRSIDDTLR